MFTTVYLIAVSVIFVSSIVDVCLRL